MGSDGGGQGREGGREGGRALGQGMEGGRVGGILQGRSLTRTLAGIQCTKQPTLETCIINKKLCTGRPLYQQYIIYKISKMA